MNTVNLMRPPTLKRALASKVADTDAIIRSYICARACSYYIQKNGVDKD